MLGKRKVSIESTYIPRNSKFSQERIEAIKAKHDITGKAAIAGRKNEPRSDDRDLDENQRAIVDESLSFVASTTRVAGAETTERSNTIRGLIPAPIETGVERANIRREVAEEKDQHRDELDQAYTTRQRTLRDLRTFEEDNKLGPFSAIYKDDRAMFITVLVLLMLGESVFNAFSFAELQDRGLVGGLLLALSVGVANVVMGLGLGFLGLRLLVHRQHLMRLLGIIITATLSIAGLSLHLALGDLRETITRDASAEINFLVILEPWRWFAYHSIPPFVLFAVGLATFLVAALKGRGGSWGIVAPYWNHEVFDRRYRAANAAFEDAKFNFKNAMQNAFDGELAKVLARLETDTANVIKIRQLVAEAEGVARTLSDSIADEIGRQHIWLRVYRDRNRTVRTTPAPAYFDVYPEFNDLRETRLDLTELHDLAQKAEQVLTENRGRVAELQEKTIEEQIATIDALMTMISSSERRAVQQIQKEDQILDGRIA